MVAMKATGRHDTCAWRPVASKQHPLLRVRAERPSWRKVEEVAVIHRSAPVLWPWFEFGGDLHSVAAWCVASHAFRLSAAIRVRVPILKVFSRPARISSYNDERPTDVACTASAIPYASLTGGLAVFITTFLFHSCPGWNARTPLGICGRNGVLWNV